MLIIRFNGEAFLIPSRRIFDALALNLQHLWESPFFFREAKFSEEITEWRGRVFWGIVGSKSKSSDYVGPKPGVNPRRLSGLSGFGSSCNWGPKSCLGPWPTSFFTILSLPSKPFLPILLASFLGALSEKSCGRLSFTVVVFLPKWWKSSLSLFSTSYAFLFVAMNNPSLSLGFVPSFSPIWTVVCGRGSLLAFHTFHFSGKTPHPSVGFSLGATLHIDPCSHSPSMGCRSLYEWFFHSPNKNGGASHVV